VIRASGESGLPQVGIVASRRVGNAVERNTAKRRIREALMNVDLQTNTAYVVVCSPAVVATEFRRLERWLDEAITDSTKRNMDEQV
jgi:ribonuclease P protein component